MKLLRFLYSGFNWISMEIRMLLVRCFTQIQMMLIPAEASREIRKVIKKMREQDSGGGEMQEEKDEGFEKVPAQIETLLVLKDMPDGSIAVELRTDPSRDLDNRIEKGEVVKATVCEAFAYATIRVLLSTQPNLVSSVTMPGLGTVRPTIYKGHAVLGNMTSEVKEMIDDKTGSVTGNKPDKSQLH